MYSKDADSGLNRISKRGTASVIRHEVNMRRSVSVSVIRHEVNMRRSVSISVIRHEVDMRQSI